MHHVRSAKHAMNLTDTTATFEHLTPRLMVQLAAPHTWAASILPVLLAVALVVAQGEPLSLVMSCVLLCISILMQSSVNTFNDYFDYVKGADTTDNQADPNDAVLVYNNISPKSALLYAIGLLVIAFVLGIYVIITAGLTPLIIALIGAAIIFLYSGGKTPISYLPIGELVSGVTMGGLISLASYQALTLRLDFMVLLFALPIIVGIGMIMFTNNACDIDKDIEAHRHTMPALLGYIKSRRAYHVTIYGWMISIVILVCVFFRAGALILPFMLLICHGNGQMLIHNPLKPATRGPAMGQCLTMNVEFGAFYIMCIIASNVIVFS